jgi:RNA polymerase sigma-70 factor (ECF subfamily)
VQSQAWFRPNKSATSAALPGDSTDAELVARLRAGDSGALDVALQRYWLPLVAYVVRYVETRDGAEDIAQRTFCLLWERRSTWQLEGSLRGLLYRVARNFALSERRHRTVELRFTAAPVESPLSNPTPLDLIENDQLRLALERAIAELPVRRREVFVLRCVHDLSYKEIADVMRISPQTVANQLSHALATLRHALAGLLDD